MKKVILVLFAFLLTIVLNGCGGGTQQAQGDSSKQDKQVVLRFSHGYPSTSQHQKNIEWFKSEVEKRTNNKVKIEIYPSSQLMPIDQEVAAMQNGTIDGAYTISAVLGAVVPENYLFDLPMLFTVKEDDMSHLKNFLLSEKGGGVIAKKAEEKGIKILSFATTEFPMVLQNNVRPIISVNDAKGLKIRIPGGKFMPKTCEILGISPMTISGMEIPTALMQGVVDGAITPPGYAYDNKLPLKYCTIIPLNFTPTCPLMMSAKSFNSLPEDVRKVFEEVGHELTIRANDIVQQQTKEKINLLKTERGVKVDYLPASEMEKLNKSFKSVWEEYASSVPDGKALLEEVERLRPAK